MKKYFLLVAALLATLAVAFGCAQSSPPASTTPAKTTPAPTSTTPAPTAAPAYTFKWNGYFAADSISGKDQEAFFANRVTQLTNGRIKFDMYPSEQLGKNTEQLSIVGGGTAQTGIMVSALSSGRMPLLGAMDLPLLYMNTDVAGHIRVASNMLYQPAMDAAFAKFNVKLVGAVSTGTLDLWFKSKPVKVLEDLKGLKIRTAGSLQSATFTAWGASPQSLTSAEVYMAISTGVVDGTVWGATSAWDNKMYEVVKYGVEPLGSVGGNTSSLLMNLDTFNKLPKDLQDAVLQAGKDATQHMIDVFPPTYQKAMSDMASKGITIYSVPKDELKRWRTAAQPVYDQWLKDNGAAGQSVLDYALKQLGS